MRDYKRIATEEAFATRDQIAPVPQAAGRWLRRPRIPQPVGLLSREHQRTRAFHRRSPAGPRAEPHRRHGCQRHRHAGAVADLARRAGVRRGHGQFTRRVQQRRAGRGHPQVPDALRRPGRRGAAGSEGRREGNRARRAQARPQGRDHEFTHHGRAARRSEVLGHLRGRRGARRACLPASQCAAARHDPALSGERTRRRGLRLPGRDRPAHAADHRVGRVRRIPEAQDSSSGTAARRCPSGCIASTTCTPPRRARIAIRTCAS